MIINLNYDYSCYILKEERTEDTVKDKEMIAALSKKNNQLIEKSQRLMQEQKVRLFMAKS